MPPQPVIIIGGGISGLTLGRCLRHKGIPFILYEKSTKSPRHNYAITLNSSYPLPGFGIPEILDIDCQGFRKATAVDRLRHAGVGQYNYGTPSKAFFQANRYAFESLLAGSFQDEIVYSHKLTSVKAGIAPTTLIFNGDIEVSGDVIVDCTGVHSPLKSTLLPASTPIVQPYVAINGKRRVTYSTFKERYLPFLGDGNCLEAIVNPSGSRSRTQHGTLMSIKVNEHDPNGDSVSISYTYSRSAFHDGGDPLYLPNRPKSGARDVPEAFFQEVGSLVKDSSLSPPFLEAFSLSKMRNDRLLHWLMRATKTPQGDLEDLAAKGVLLIGEAAYAEPIIGGRGASHAIEDAMSVATAIDGWWREGVNRSDIASTLAMFYAKGTRWDDRETQVEKSILSIKEAHRIQ